MATNFTFKNGRLHLDKKPLSDREIMQLRSLLESADAETAARIYVRPQWLAICTAKQDDEASASLR